MSQHQDVELAPILSPTPQYTNLTRHSLGDNALRVDSSVRISSSTNAAANRSPSQRTQSNTAYSPSNSVNTQDAINITNHNNNAMYNATADQSASGQSNENETYDSDLGAREGEDYYDASRRIRRYRYSGTADGDEYTPDNFVARHALRATRPGMWATRRRHMRHQRDHTTVSNAVRTLALSFPSRKKARIAGLVQMVCVILAIIALVKEPSPIPLVLLIPALFSSATVQFHCRSDELIAIEDRTLHSSLRENSSKWSLKARKIINTRNMAFGMIATACFYAPVCTFFCGFPLLILLFGDSTSIGGSANSSVSWSDISAYLQIGRILCFASVPVSSIALARYYVLLKDEGFHFGESRQAALWRLALVTIRDLQRRVIDIETQELGEEEEEEEEEAATAATRERAEEEDESSGPETTDLGASTNMAASSRRRSVTLANPTPQLGRQFTLTQSVGSLASAAQPAGVISQLNIPVFTNAFAQRSYSNDDGHRPNDSYPLDAGPTFVSDMGGPTFASSAGGNTPNHLAAMTSLTLDMPIISVARFSATNTANNSTTQHPGQAQTAMNMSMSLDIPAPPSRTVGFGLSGVNVVVPVAAVTANQELTHSGEHRFANRITSFVAVPSENGTTDSRTATFIERTRQTRERASRRKALRDARRAAFFIDIWSIYSASSIPVAATICLDEQQPTGDTATAAASDIGSPSVGENTEPPTIEQQQRSAQSLVAPLSDVYAYEEDGTPIPRVADGVLASEYVAYRIRQLREGNDEVVRLARDNPAAFGGEVLSGDDDSRRGGDDGVDEGEGASIREANIHGARGPMSLLAALLSSVIQTQLEGDEDEADDGASWENYDDEQNSMNQLQNHFQPYRPQDARDRVIPMRPEASVTFPDLPEDAPDADPQSAATMRRIVSCRAAAAATVVARSLERHSSYHSAKHSQLLPHLSCASLPQAPSSPSSPVVANCTSAFEFANLADDSSAAISPSMAGSVGGVVDTDGRYRRVVSKARRRLPLRDIPPQDFFRDKRVGGRYY